MQHDALARFGILSVWVQVFLYLVFSQITYPQILRIPCKPREDWFGAMCLAVGLRWYSRLLPRHIVPKPKRVFLIKAGCIISQMELPLIVHLGWEAVYDRKVMYLWHGYLTSHKARGQYIRLVLCTSWITIYNECLHMECKDSPVISLIYMVYIVPKIKMSWFVKSKIAFIFTYLGSAVNQN